MAEQLHVTQQLHKAEQLGGKGRMMADVADVDIFARRIRVRNAEVAAS